MSNSTKTTERLYTHNSNETTPKAMLPYSQAYHATTLSDLWEYTLLPADQRISLRRKTECGRPACENKLRPAHEVSDKREGGRIVCPSCRDQLWCSQACAKRDKRRHALECAHNKTDILKCTILEDTAGVVSFLLKDPKLSTKQFGGHFILEWARRVGYEPTVLAINGVVAEALENALKSNCSKELVLHLIDAGVTITDAHLEIAGDHKDLLVVARDTKKPQLEEKSKYTERAPPPPEEPKPTLQEEFEQRVKEEKEAEVPTKRRPPMPRYGRAVKPKPLPDAEVAVRPLRFFLKAATDVPEKKLELKVADLENIELWPVERKILEDREQKRVQMDRECVMFERHLASMEAIQDIDFKVPGLALDDDDAEKLEKFRQQQETKRKEEIQEAGMARVRAMRLAHRAKVKRPLAKKVKFVPSRLDAELLSSARAALRTWFFGIELIYEREAERRASDREQVRCEKAWRPPSLPVQKTADQIQAMRSVPAPGCGCVGIECRC